MHHFGQKRLSLISKYLFKVSKGVVIASWIAWFATKGIMSLLSIFFQLTFGLLLFILSVYIEEIRHV